MNILFATSEAVPFCKTGGLGDVCGALPVELAKLGMRPTVILPAFKHALESGQPIESTGEKFQIAIGRKIVAGEFLRSHLPNSDVQVLLVKQDDYFNRPEIYRENDRDYHDNCERFVFFNRAVLEAIPRFDLKTDVLHCHDWPTGLLPAYLKTTYAKDPRYQSIASLFTIHNLAYQGAFWHWDMELTGVGWEYFNWQQMEFYGQLNFMKSALVFADALSTVSPRYAEEIQSPPMSCGLEGILQHRKDDLYGVLNGVDYSVWSPTEDPHIACNYGINNFVEGKAACKTALQAEMGLPYRPETPLIASVGRLADQKGFDMIAEILPRWAQQHDVQWVLLGSGDQHYHHLLEALARDYPERIAVKIGFSNELAHRIEAGADMFLMPSRYEPCGLNQMYSLKYGTVPIVRETGGLADTVTNTTDATLNEGMANGYSFADASGYALSSAIDRACRDYAITDRWRQVIANGMRQDWSWANSARRYVDLYDQTIARLQEPALSK